MSNVYAFAMVTLIGMDGLPEERSTRVRVLELLPFDARVVTADLRDAGTRLVIGIDKLIPGTKHFAGAAS